MIFVILGTQDKSFIRLIEKIDELKKEKKIKEQVIIQAGSTKYNSNNLKIIDYLSMEEFNKYIKESDYVITHGGVGSILDAIKYDKKVIAVPRLKQYDEHENNHQLQIVQEFVDLGYILSSDLSDLDIKIKEIKNFKPKKFISNNKKMIRLIEDFIDKY